MTLKEGISEKVEVLNVGRLLSVRGSVVDMHFEKYLPPVFSLLHAHNKKLEQFSAELEKKASRRSR